jgi:histidine triad (HIT) family protein
VTAGACIFCRIAAGEIPATVVTQDDELLAFRDINPVAPTHILVIPRRHIASVNALEDSDEALMGRMTLMARSVAIEEGLSSGYRLVMNTGRDGGQSVDHVHMHVLGGRAMRWPPG